MATKKGAGTAKNLTDSKPKYLGVKLYDGQQAKKGSVIVRQRGTRTRAGKNVGIGKDHTLFALADGTVKFRNARRTKYDGRTKTHSVVDVL